MDLNLSPLSRNPYFGGPPRGIKIGPLTKLMADRAKWRREDRFPASQVWADEIERILTFLDAQDQFSRFLPRLRDKSRARDAALAEARVAFFLFRNGFRLVEWDPPGNNGRIGEFSIQWNNGPVVFVEVKAPDWEGELTKEELMGARKKLGKYVDLEARCVDSLAQPIEVLEKNAIPKLTEDRPNLVVIADDLFISPAGMPHLKARIDEELRKPDFSRLGGLLFFKAEQYRNEIEYNVRFHANLDALAPCRMPEDIVKGLTYSSQSDEAREQQRRSGPPPLPRFLKQALSDD